MNVPLIQTEKHPSLFLQKKVIPTFKKKEKHLFIKCPTDNIKKL